MAIEKVPPLAGGVPTPLTGDNGKALVADGVGGYAWNTVTATIPPVTAASVSFDNTAPNIPGAPTNAQDAIADVYARIPTNRVVKFAEETGGWSTYAASLFIREDGVAVYNGRNTNVFYGPDVVVGSSTSDPWMTPASITTPTAISVPVVGSKVHMASCGFQSVYLVAGTSTNPRSMLWASGTQIGDGGSGAVTTLKQVGTTASTAGQRIKKIFSTNFNSAYHNTYYIRDDGTLWATGNRYYYQLGTGEAVSTTPQYGFVEATSGALTYTGGQVVTNVFATGLSLYIEVTTDNTNYTLLSCGYNPNGNLGLGFINAGTTGGANYSVPTLTQCKTSALGNPAIASVGQFKKIVASENQNDGQNQTTVFALAADGTLYYAGRTLGGTGNSLYFQQLDTAVVDVAVTGANASAGSVIWVKSDGSVKGAGNNLWGELGNGTTTAVPLNSAISIGSFSPSLKAVECYAAPGAVFSQFFVRVDTGAVYAAGHNDSGSLGLTTGVTTQTLSYTQCNLPEAIQANGIRTCHDSTGTYTYFLGASGTVYATGCNNEGQLGIHLNIRTMPIPVEYRIPVGNWKSGTWAI